MTDTSESAAPEVWSYYAVFEPPYSSADAPQTLLRQPPGATRDDAERLTKDGTWRPSDLVALIYLGHNEKELHEITRARAIELAQEWHARGTLRSLPADLAGV
jgi:hypothetical protein